MNKVFLFFLIITCLTVLNKSCLGQSDLPDFWAYMQNDTFNLQKIKKNKLDKPLSYPLKGEVYYDELWDFSASEGLLAYIIPKTTGDTIYMIDEWDNSYTNKHVIDTFHFYPVCYYDIQFVWFSDKGKVLRQDSFLIRDDNVFKIKFVGNKLLINAEKADNRPGFSPNYNNGWIDVRDSSLSFNPISPPFEYLYEFNLLEHTATCNDYFYSLQPKHYLEYFVHKYATKDGFVLEQQTKIPKKILDILAFTCDGHDYISNSGDIFFTANDSWTVFFANLSCYGQMTMFEDCLGFARFLAIMNSKTLEIQYLWDISSLSCGSDEVDTIGYSKVSIGVVDKIYLDKDILYLTNSSDSLLFINLLDTNLAKINNDETNKKNNQVQQSELIRSCMHKLTLPYKENYLYQLPSQKVIVTDKKHWTYLSVESKK